MGVYYVVGWMMAAKTCQKPLAFVAKIEAMIL